MSKMDWKLLALSSLLAVSSIFQMGYTNAYPNTAISGFRKFLNQSAEPPMSLKTFDFEWIWSAMLAVYFIGFAMGSLLASRLADRLGRKWSLFVGTTGSLLSAFIALFAIILKCPSTFGFSRLVMAFSAAVSMNAMIILFQESAPEHMKGVISFNAEMAFVVTNLIGGLFGMQEILGQNLVGLVAVSIVPSALACFLAAFLKESPKYLFLSKNDIMQADRSLQFYQNLKEKDEIIKVFNQMELEREKWMEETGDIPFDVFEIESTKRGFQLGFATMQLTVSIWPLIFFSTDFLRDAGFSYSAAETVSTVMLFVSTLSTLCGMFVVERFSRKWLLIGTASVNVTALLVFSMCSIATKNWEFLKYGCVAGLILHGISYSIGMGPIAWFITSELVPTESRAVAQSLVLASNHSIALLIAFLTFPLYKMFGPTILVVFYVIPGMICILILIFYLPETKDKHINEIVEQLKNGINNGNRPQE